MGKNIDIQRDDSFDEQPELLNLFWLSDYHSQIVKLQYIADSDKEFIAISDDLLIQLNHSARDIGMSLDDLIDQWASEKLNGNSSSSSSNLFM